MGLILLLVIVCTLLPYASVAMMQRWWTSLLMAAGWCIGTALVERLPRDGEDLGISVIFAIYAVLGLAVGLLLQFMRWCQTRKGWRILIALAGFALPPAAAVALDRWHTWDHRGPDVACAASTFDIRVGALPLHIPARSTFNIHLGANDVYYLKIPKFVRLLCDRVEASALAHPSGRRYPLQASLVALDLHNDYELRRAFCTSPAEWTRELCTSVAEKRPAAAWPVKISVFEAQRFTNPGYFGGTRSTYDDSQRGDSSHDHYFVSASRKTPDGKPFAARCYSTSGGGSYCSTSYPWREEASLHFDFRAPKDDIEAVSARVDAMVRTFVEGLMTTP